MSDGVIGGLTAQINVVAKTATYSGAGSAWTSVSGKVEDYGNGWFRVSVTGTSVGGGGGWYEMAANGATNSCFVWGFQLELGSYSTSYIPTTSASVTRNADVISKTGISSLIGQTDGTMFVDYNYEGKPDVNGNIPIVIYNGTNEAYIYIAPNGILLCELANSGAIQGSIAGNIGAVGRKKIAFAYKQNDFVVYMNGTQIGTDTSGTVGAMSTIILGSYYLTNFNANGGINAAALWKTRLTNTQLAQLTTI
jgi:hypothetical protein